MEILLFILACGLIGIALKTLRKGIAIIGAIGIIIAVIGGLLGWV